jgi:hypothetical protein
MRIVSEDRGIATYGDLQCFRYADLTACVPQGYVTNVKENRVVIAQSA